MRNLNKQNITEPEKTESEKRPILILESEHDEGYLKVIFLEDGHRTDEKQRRFIKALG